MYERSESSLWYTADPGRVVSVLGRQCSSLIAAFCASPPPCLLPPEPTPCLLFR